MPSPPRGPLQGAPGAEGVLPVPPLSSLSLSQHTGCCVVIMHLPACLPGLVCETRAIGLGWALQRANSRGYSAADTGEGWVGLTDGDRNKSPEQ